MRNVKQDMVMQKVYGTTMLTRLVVKAKPLVPDRIVWI